MTTSVKAEPEALDMGDLSTRITNLPADKRALLEAWLREAGMNVTQLPMPPRRRGLTPVPVSFAQQRLWFLNRLTPDNPFYNMTSAFRLSGPLDIAALARTFNEIVRRHEALRTTFSTVDGQPVQIIAPTLTLPFTVEALQGLAAPEREAKVQQRARAEGQRLFDLARGPLLHISLLQLSHLEHVLLLTMHHIIADGWSLGVLQREMAALYEDFSSGKPARLPALPIQYADFALWQREWLRGDVLEAQMSYWRQQLEALPAVLRLPTARPRPAVQTFHGRRQAVALPKHLHETLRRLSQGQGCTLFMTLLAVFQILLQRYTGQDDMAVGSPIANRNRREIERLIGFFANSLVMRTDLSGNPTFQQLLARVRDVTLGAYAHQDVPFEMLVEHLQPSRDLSRNPFFQVVFALQNAPMEPLVLRGLSLQPLAFDNETTRFDLELHLWEQPQGLSGYLVYNADLFEAATMARMVEHFCTLLEGIAAHPERHIADLPLLTAAEQQQLLAWAATPMPYALEACRPLLPAADDATPGNDATNLAVYVLDRTLRLAPIGVPGDIYIGGEGLVSGDLERLPEGQVPAESRPGQLIHNPVAAIPGDHLCKTGETGRWLSDGRLELLRATNMQDSRMALREVEAALRQHPLVEDCAVLARQTEASEPAFVAYVVWTDHSGKAKLERAAFPTLPASLPPLYFLPVTRLPLTPTGQVDEAALARLEVVDEALLERWQERLQAVPGVGQVAVLVRETAAPRAPLHLADLIPDWRHRGRAVRGSPGGVEATREQAASAPGDSHPSSPTAPRSRAISHGGALRRGVEVPSTLSAALRRAALQSPDKGVVYLQSDASEIFQSYAALLEEAERILAGLRGLGLEPQDQVIFQLDRNQDFIPAFWGCVLGGFVPVPLPIAPTYAAPHSTVNKLHHAWQMLNVPLVLTSAGLAPAIRALDWGMGQHTSTPVAEQVTLRVASLDALRGCHPDCQAYAAAPDEVTLLLLTSGSTGQPKAVMQSHRSLLSRSAGSAQMNDFSSQDVSLNWMPLDHVGGIVMFHVRDVYVGCQQIHAPTAMVLQDPLQWLDWIDHYRATITWAPNFAYGLINEHLDARRRRHWDLSCMRFILNGGEAIVPKTARRFLQRLGPHGLPSTCMHPAWGMSETSSGVTYSDRFALATTTDDEAFVEVGAPIAGVSLRIVDAHGALVEEGVVGRLQVKGTPVTSGYYQAPALNREAFTPDGWFQTGDLGFLCQGRLTITGREKDVIIIHGVNYASAEIEAAVEDVAGVEVSYTAACAVRDPGSDTDSLAIFFSPSALADCFPEAGDFPTPNGMDLLGRIRQSVLHSVGVHPAYLIPVQKAEIPKTAIGKIQRAELQQRFAAGAFDTLLKRLDLLAGNAHTLPDWFFRRLWRRKELRGGRSSTLPSGTSPPVSLVFLDRLGFGQLLAETLGKLDWQCVLVEAGSDFVRRSAAHYCIAPNHPEHYQRLLASIAGDGQRVEQILHLWTYDAYAGAIASLEALAEAQYHGVYSLVFLIQALAQMRGDTAAPGRMHHGPPAQPDAAPDAACHLYVLSSHIQPTSPADKLAAEKSTIIGLLKTIPLDLPWLQCRHIDFDVAAGETALAAQVKLERVLRELRLATGEAEVAYRRGQRLVPTLAKVDMLQREPRAVPIRQGGVYLVSGGLGGIGTPLAQFLMQAYGTKLLLVGRTALPERQHWSRYREGDTHMARRIANYLALEATGGEFAYAAVDVCNLDHLQHHVAAAESRWQAPLAGIIHLAGEGNLAYHWTVIDQHSIVVETPQTFDAMFRPKVYGTWTLYQLIKDRPQAVFISFSSVNGLFGAATFSAYSAANSFLDCYTLHQRYHAQRQSYCFTWTMWDDIGMSQGNPAYAREASRTMGYHIISKEQGLHSLIAALWRDHPQLIVGLDGNTPRIRRQVETESYQAQHLCAYFTTQVGRSDSQHEGADPAPRTRLEAIEIRDRFGTSSRCDLVQLAEMPLTAAGDIDRTALLALGRTARPATTERVTPQTDLERTIAAIWSEALHVEAVSTSDNFFELGGHSILLAQVHSKLQITLARDLSIVDLFRYPTINALAKHLGQAQQDKPSYQQSHERAARQREVVQRQRQRRRHGRIASQA